MRRKTGFNSPEIWGMLANQVDSEAARQLKELLRSYGLGEILVALAKLARAERLRLRHNELQQKRRAAAKRRRA